MISDFIDQRDENSSEGEEKIVRFQALFSTKNWQSVVEKCYKEVLDDFNSNNESAGDFSLDDYIIKEKNESWFVGFDVNFFLFYDENEKRSCVESFIESLKDASECQWIWRFCDFEIDERNKKYYKKISRIEMKIREVLSYILWNVYGEKENLLRDYNILEGVKNYQKNKIKIAKELDAKSENILFCISFSAYINFTDKNLKKIKYEEVFDSLKTGVDFEQWREKMMRRGVQKQVHVDFIASLTDNMPVIDKIRNGISHSRYVFDEDITSFDKSYEKVEESIKDFWSKEREDEKT